MDKSKPAQRPDLFCAPQAGSSDSRRILASLENSYKSGAPATALERLRPGHLVLGLALLAMLAAAVACYSYVGMAPAQRNKAFAVSKRQTPLVTAPQEVERMAAAIVNEPLPAIRPATHKQVVAPLAAAVTSATPTTTAPAAPASTARGRTPAAQTTRAHSQPSLSAIAAARPRVAALQDSDVALLAAMVAHTGGQTAAPVPQAIRDVVERKEGDSTDALLRRCQLLGGVEAGLCRARICKGQWINEAACRAPVVD